MISDTYIAITILAEFHGREISELLARHFGRRELELETKEQRNRACVHIARYVIAYYAV